jgi:hypothetical protein
MKITRGIVVVVCGIGLLAGCTSTNSTAPPTSPGTSARPTTNATGRSANPTLEAAVDKTVQNAIKERHLRVVIVRVLVDGQEIITRAYGESMTGVPATTDMHFRNGRIRDPLRLHSAIDARRREKGQSRRQGLEVGSGDPTQR